MRVLIFTLMLGLLTTSAFATQQKKTLKLRLQNASTGNLDEATVYFDLGIAPSYNYQEDAQKVFGGVPGVPQIWTVTNDNMQVSINGFSMLSNTEVVSVSVDVDQTGSYRFVPALLDNFDETSIVRLEDKSNNTFHDLRSGMYVTTIDENEATDGRFFIHVSTPIMTSSSNSDCSNSNGSVSASFDNSITWTLCNLYDATNTQIGSFTNVNTPVDFTGLAAGTYTMILNYGSYTVTKQFDVKGNFVTTNASVSTPIAMVGQEVEFFANATNSSSFVWEFGDGTLITGVANPSLSFFEPGTYDVKVKASNIYGCQDESQLSITVEKSTSISDVQTDVARVFASQKDVTVQLSSDAKNAQLDIFNLLGQNVYSNNLGNGVQKVNLGSQPNGYYVVEVKNNSERYTQKVYLGN